MVFELHAGRYKNKKLGMATDASIFAVRTNRSRSGTFQRRSLVADAAEWADLNGADIISSSLGYG
jgi:hypothetical protein